MAEKNSLWKNIRANRGSGRKPTTEMLRQERKIKAKQYAEGSFVQNQTDQDPPINTPTYSGGTLPAFEVVAEAPQWLKYKNEYEETNPKLNKYLTPFARGLGNDEVNYPKRIDDEYNNKLYSSYTDKLLDDFSFEFTDKEQELVDKYFKTERDKQLYKFLKEKEKEKRKSTRDKWSEATGDITFDTLVDQVPDIAENFKNNRYVDKALKLPHLNKIKAAYQFLYEGRPLTAVSELIKIPKASSIGTDALMNAAQENPTGYDLATFENKYLSPVRLGALKNNQIISDIGKEIVASGETKDSNWSNRHYNLPALIDAGENFSKKYGVSQNDFTEFIENYMVGRNKSYKETLDAYEKYLQSQLDKKATGGYYPTQGPPKALFKGYAEGGYMYPDGGKTKKPKVYTDLKEFKKAEQMYNDSLSLHLKGLAEEKIYKDFINKAGFDDKYIGTWGTQGYVDNDYHKSIGPVEYGILKNRGGGFRRDNKNNPINYTIYTLKNGRDLNVDDNSKVGKILKKRYPKFEKPTQPVEYKEKSINKTPVQVDRLESKKITNIPIEEPQLNLKTLLSPKPERQTVMLHQRNQPAWGVRPENDPNQNYIGGAGLEYNMGDRTGWHDILKGPYISNGVTYNSYVDYLKANPDLYDVQGGFAQGGYTNPYNQYQDDPYLNYANGGYMYARGGGLGKEIAAGAYGAFEGLVDTTFGWIPGVDMATDFIYKGLQKVGKSTPDQIRKQNAAHGFAQTAGAVGSAILTGGATTAGAISEGAQGIGQGIAASNQSKDWAEGAEKIIGGLGSGVGLVYGNTGSAKNATSAFKATEAGSQGLGKFAAASPIKGFSAAPKGTMQGVIDGNAVSMKPGTSPALSSITPTTSIGTFSNPNVTNINTPSNLDKTGNVVNAVSDLPKSQEPPPMAPPIASAPLPELPPQTDYNQFAINTPDVNAGLPEINYNNFGGYDPSSNVFSQGGNMLNNSLNLHNTMRYKRFAKGGTFDQFGINFIPESAGLHHESANGGVPIGPNALAEGGEAKLQMADGGQYIVSGEVDGANTQSINGETMTQRLKKKLKPFMMGGLASNPKDKDALRRPFDSYSAESIAQAKEESIQETEAVRMQRGGAVQYAAHGGKLTKDIEKIVMEEYTAAYGGVLPNKYKGKVNMPNSYAKGGIHIKESKKGTFTAAATKHGKSVQEFAQQVLANKENYSPGMVKKANFAHNAAGWNHANGGYVHNQMTQPMLAEGGPIYGDPASEYVYARGGMYGNPYYRGGQIDYTNDMYSSYANGGPMVGNAPQAFRGPAAQNRGGMLMTYADGGMMPQEQQMMQEQQMQQQGGQDQMMQMVQQIMEALMQGANPEQIMQELMQQLVQSGMPEEQAMQQAQQIMQVAMQEVQGQQQQQQPQGQPMQEGQQPMQGEQQMMARGGRMFYTGGEDDKKKKGFSNPADESQFMNYDQYGNTYYDDGFRPYNYTGDPVVGEGDYVSNSILDQIRAARRPIVEDYSGPIVQPTAPRVDAGNIYEPSEFLQPKKVGPLTVNADNKIVQGTDNSLPGLVPMDLDLPEDVVKKPGGSQGLSTSDWIDLGTGALSLAGSAHQFFQPKPKPFQYQKAKATTLDPTTAIILANQASREAQALADYNIKQNAPTSGSYLANIRANALQSGIGRGKTGAGIRQQYDINNAGILNQMEQYNTEIENRNIDAIQQDEANWQTQRTNALYNAGANLAGMRKDYKGNQINETIAKNLGTNNWEYDQATETFKFRNPNGQMITVPAATVLGTNPTNLGTGQMQQAGTSQFQSNFDERANQAFRNKFRGINSGK